MQQNNEMMCMLFYCLCTLNTVCTNVCYDVCCYTMLCCFANKRNFFSFLLFLLQSLTKVRERERESLCVQTQASKQKKKKTKAFSKRCCCTHTNKIAHNNNKSYNIKTNGLLQAGTFGLSPTVVIAYKHQHTCIQYILLYACDQLYTILLCAFIIV